MRCDLKLCSCQRAKFWLLFGDDRDRTGDLLLAKQALSQLSYVPLLNFLTLVGASGIEPLTPALSARCSTN